MPVLCCGWVITGCLWFSLAGLSLSPGHSTGYPWDLLKLIACSSTADFEYSVVVCLDSWCQTNLFYCCSAGEGEWQWSLWNICRLSVLGGVTQLLTQAQCPLSPWWPCLTLLPVRPGKSLNQSPARAALVNIIDLWQNYHQFIILLVLRCQFSTWFLALEHALCLRERILRE